MAEEHRDGRDARLVSWTAFVGGTMASVAANVAHARLRPSDAGPGWQPEVGAQIAAAFWPLALLGAVEVLTRVPWPRGWLWALARYAGTGAVAAGAAVLSYRHMAALLAAWGEDDWNAHIGPLVVDGLMVIAGTALLALSRRHRPLEREAVAQRDAVTRREPVARRDAVSGQDAVTRPVGAVRPQQAHATSAVVPAGYRPPAAPERPRPDAQAPGAGTAPGRPEEQDLGALSQEEARERARADFRRALERGNDLSSIELARRYERSVRWASDQRRAVREELAREQEEHRLAAMHN